MTPSNLIQEDLGNSRSVGPGDRLRAARNDTGLSIEDVATRMHLSIRILESIEDNNFDDITAPIFVKGYLRAYARIVSLDEDEMIQQYQNYYSEEDPPISSTSNLAPEISSDDARIKWTTYLVIIGLLGLLAAWWWSQYQLETDVVSLDAEPAETMQQPEANPESSIVEIESLADPMIITTEQVDVWPELIDESEPTELTTIVEVQGQVIPEPIVIDTVEEVEPTIEEAEPQEAVVENEPAQASEDNSRIAPTGTDQLKIIVHADTWVVIKDANGNPLARELLRADQTLDLIGKAPFAVFLGNGHGVELIYQNETIDFADRIRDNNTARLKVGSS